MKLKELQLRNWLLFREADISFKQAGSVIGIVGHYVDEDARSNRSGKSTFTEAIRFLFYGRGRDNQGQKLINRTAQEDGEDMSVTGILALQDGREIVVTRGRSHDNKGFLEISGMEGAKIAEGDEYLAELIGFDAVEYDSTCFFQQGDTHRFMLARPAEKRDLIQRWLRQDRWGRRQAFADGQCRALRTEGEGLTMALAAIPEIGKSTAQLEKDLAGAKRRHGKAKGRLGDALEAREMAQAALHELERARDTHERADVLEGRIRAATEKLDTARQKSKARQKAKAKRDREREKWEELREGMDLGVRERSKAISGEQAKELQLIERRDQLDGLKGVCPVLEQECPRVGNEAVEPLNVELERIKCHLVQLEEEATQFQDDYREVVKQARDKVRKAEREIERNEYAPPSTFRETIDELTTEIEETLASLAGYHDKEEIPALIAQAEKEATAQRERITRARELESDAGQLMAQARSELEQAKQATRKRKELTDRLADVERDRVAWAYCKYMMGSRGIPGAIMESSFGILEGDINAILERMNTDLSVRFQPYRETRQWEKTCLACGSGFEKTRQRKCEGCGEARQRKRVDQLILQIVDQFEGQLSEFGLDSGGGKTLLSFAVRLALMFMKTREAAGDLPPIILDEILADLDSINRAAVLGLVQNVLIKRYGIEQAFVISHSREVQESLEDVLVVTRHNSHSTVAWA